MHYSAPGSIEEAHTPNTSFSNIGAPCNDSVSGINDSSLNRLLSSPGMSTTAQAPPSVDKENILKGNNLEHFLTGIWDKQTEENEGRRMKEAESRGIKRKVPDDEAAVSGNETVGEDSAIQSGGVLTSKLSQKNVLLAQLLSKKATKESVVNTHHTVNPASTPQNALPKNLSDKIIDTKLSAEENRLEQQHPPDSTDNLKEIAQTPTDWDSPQTDPNTPFPGNTSNKDNNNMKLGAKGKVLSDGTNSNSCNVLDQLLSQSGGNNSAAVVATDPLLSQILQEVSEINQSPGTPINFDQPMTDDSNLIQQLEQALKTSNLPLAEIDNLLGISSGGNSGNSLRDMNEQMAIDAIQQQLMNIEQETPNSSGQTPTSVSQASVRPSVAVRNSNALATFLQGAAGQNPGVENHIRHQLQQLQQHQQHPSATPQPSPQPGFAPNANMLSPPYTPQGPRFPQPQG